jgi:SAM-dependent methyltransferase
VSVTDSALGRYARFELGRVRRRLSGRHRPFGHLPRSADAIARMTVDRYCNVCDWSGTAFDGFEHCESNGCPDCGSIARDRFVNFLAINLQRTRRGASIIETSPRLGHDYRIYMKRLFRFRTGDYDLVSHKGDLFLDLQKIDLPPNSIDVFITAHVLEHVPDYVAATKELFRVVSPGGLAVVAVPLLNGTTCQPTEPEYHEDNTAVHWRFGWDLKEHLEAAGFQVDIAVTAPFASVLAERQWSGVVSGEFDVASLLADPPTVLTCMDAASATRLGLQPCYQFVGFVCRKAKVSS